jgi:hypothetical protein
MLNTRERERDFGIALTRTGWNPRPIPTAAYMAPE